MMLPKSTNPLRSLAFTFALSAGVLSACGGTSTPQPLPDWLEKACDENLVGGADCDPIGMAGGGGMGGMPMAMAGSGMGGTMMNPVGGPCDAVADVFSSAVGGCAGGTCHNAGSLFGGFVDDPAEDFLGDGVAGCALIDTTNPEDSSIYARLSGEGPCAGGSFMPLGAAEPADSETLECVLSWVTQFGSAAADPVVVEPPPGGGDGAVGGEPCDAVAEVFSLQGEDGGCQGGSCHGPSSFFGAFADDPASDFFGDGAGACATIDTTNAVNSKIYGRMTQEGDCGGNPMPTGGVDESSDEQKACVLSWLTQFEGQ